MILPRPIIDAWWAGQIAKGVGAGHKWRQGLIELLNLSAVTQAHKVANTRGLSEAESEELVAYALSVAKAPKQQ